MKHFKLKAQETSAIAQQNLGAALKAMDAEETFTIGRSMDLEDRMRAYDKNGFKKPKKREESCIYQCSANELTEHDLSALGIEALYLKRYGALKDCGERLMNTKGGGEGYERVTVESSKSAGIYIRKWSEIELQSVQEKKEQRLKETKRRRSFLILTHQSQSLHPK